MPGPTHSINVAHLTFQQQVQLLMSLSITRFSLSIDAEFKALRLRIEHQVQGLQVTTAKHRTHHLPVPSGCAMCYYKDAGHTLNIFYIRILMDDELLISAPPPPNYVKQNHHQLKSLNICTFYNPNILFPKILILELVFSDRGGGIIYSL